MRMERQKETPRGFLYRESSGTSNHWCEKPVRQQVFQRSTMPTFLTMGNGGSREQETLED